eukprot:gene20049-20580_t
MGSGLAIRTDIEVETLRRYARHEADGRVASRLLAIANALSGMSRQAAAEAGGMDRQTLRDWVVRFNAEGIGGLADRPRPGRPTWLDEGEQAVLKAIILRGPDPEKDGDSAFRAIDVCRIAKERFGVDYSENGMLQLMKSLGLSRQKTRPRHPEGDPAAKQAFKKGALPGRHPDEDVQLWFQDEARVGQKGRNVHIWYEKGIRPTALTDRRFKSAYIYGAVRPGSDDAFALVLPRADTAMMQIFLDDFSAALEPHVHAILVMDKAGWHVTGRLKLPANVSLVHLPSYSPELNPVERVWLYLKQRFLSHRLFADERAIVEACARAWNWNDLLAETGRIASLTAYPYLKKGGNMTLALICREALRSTRSVDLNGHRGVNPPTLHCGNVPLLQCASGATAVPRSVERCSVSCDRYLSSVSISLKPLIVYRNRFLEGSPVEKRPKRTAMLGWQAPVFSLSTQN